MWVCHGSAPRVVIVERRGRPDDVTCLHCACRQSFGRRDRGDGQSSAESRTDPQARLRNASARMADEPANGEML